MATKYVVAKKLKGGPNDPFVIPTNSAGQPIVHVGETEAVTALKDAMGKAGQGNAILLALVNVSVEISIKVTDA